MVVTGTVAAGAAKLGDRLLLSPRGVEVRVRGVHAQNRPAESAGAGERCALNLAGVFPEGASRAAATGSSRRRCTRRPTASISASSCRRRRRRRCATGCRCICISAPRTWSAAARRARRRGAGARRKPGFVQLDLDHAVGALWGDRAVLRDHAARHTLAGGRVLDPAPPRRGRARPERLAVLEAQREPDPARRSPAWSRSPGSSSWRRSRSLATSMPARSDRAAEGHFCASARRARRSWPAPNGWRLSARPFSPR